MKITPIAGPAIAGIVNPGAPTTTGDKKAAAIEAFLGSSKHKITPADVPVDAQAQQQQNVRKIKMRTNFSPDRFMEEAETAPSAPQPNEMDQTQDPQVERLTASKPISPQMAELQRQRRALAKEREAFNKEKATQSQTANMIELAKIKESPLKILKDAGVTYDELTQAVLADGNSNIDVEALKAQLLEETKNTFKTELSQRDAEVEKAALRQIRMEADQLIKSTDEFKGIRETRKQNDVVRLVNEIYRKEGHVIDTYEAAQAIEAEIQADAKRFASIYGYAEQQAQPQVQQSARQPQFRTLSNRQTAVAPMSPKARAIAAFYGTLKK